MNFSVFQSLDGEETVLSCPNCQKEMSFVSGVQFQKECQSCEVSAAFILFDDSLSLFDFGWRFGSLLFRHGEINELLRTIKLRSFQ